MILVRFGCVLGRHHILRTNKLNCSTIIHSQIVTEEKGWKGHDFLNSSHRCLINVLSSPTLSFNKNYYYHFSINFFFPIILLKLMMRHLAMMAAACSPTAFMLCSWCSCECEKKNKTSSCKLSRAAVLESKLLWCRPWRRSSRSQHPRGS